MPCSEAKKKKIPTIASTLSNTQAMSSTANKTL